MRGIGYGCVGAHVTREERLSDLVRRFHEAGDRGLLLRDLARQYALTRQRLYQDLRELVKRGYPVEPAGYGRWRFRTGAPAGEWWSEDELYRWLCVEGYCWLELTQERRRIAVAAWWESLGRPRPTRYRVLRGPAPYVALVYVAGGVAPWAIAMTAEAARNYRS